MPDESKEPRMIYRDVVLEIETRQDDDGRKRHRFAVSSEEPVERFFGMEVLQHTRSAVDRKFLRDGLPVFRSDRLPNFLEGGHNGVQVGLFDNDKVEEKKLRGDVRFEDTEIGNETEGLVEKGFRRRVSIGYSRQAFKEKPGEGDVPTVRTYTRWTPMEVHILPLGADVTVGPGRGEYEIENEEETTMEKNPGEGKETRTEPAPAPATPEAPATPTPAPAARVETRDLGQEAAEIVELCTANGVPERAAPWIREGLNPDQVGRAVLELKRTEGPAQPAAEDLPSVVSERDVGRYSYRRAILQSLERGAKDFDGIEGEVHAELRKAMPSDMAYKGGILVPMRLRVLDAMTSGAGVETVDTDRGEFIQLLRNRTRTVFMGGRLLTGLSGPIAFTKQTGGISVGWVGENPGADGPDSDLALGQVLMGPKTLQGSTGYSRQLLAQASMDIENLVRDDLAAGHGLAYDLTALHGIGAAAEPIGIYNAPDVQAKAFGGNPTFALMVDMQGLVADANAEEGSLGYMTNPLTASFLKQTPEHATLGSGDWIWKGPVSDGVVAGYKATATKQVRGDLGAGAEQGIIYGNWSDVMIGVWGAMELVVDPFSKKKQALIEVTSFQMADIGIRHGESFCKATGATLP